MWCALLVVVAVAVVVAVVVHLAMVLVSHCQIQKRPM